MADEPVLGSLNATLAKKMADKYDPELEKGIRKWLSETLEKPEIADEATSVHASLKDGTLLCELLNKLAPGSVKRVNKTTLAFKQIENISKYLNACGALGMSEGDRFQTIDLFESKDMNTVLNHLRVLKLLSEKHKGNLSHLRQAAPAKKISSPSPSKRASWNFKKDAAAAPGSTKVASPAPARRQASVTPAKVPDVADVSSLEDDVKTKEEFKYSPELEKGAKVWIRKLLADDELFTSGSFASGLKSGVVLCKVVNAILPGTIGKISTSKFGFAQMENIGNYLTACVEKLGLKKTVLFDTPDLYEERSMNLVINHIHVLAHHVEKLPAYSGPKIGDFSQVRTLYSASLGEPNLDDIIGSESAKEEDVELDAEEQEMVDFVNNWLRRKFDEQFVIKKLATRSVQSGVVLLKLCEALTKCEVGPYEEKPTILWHCMQNASLIRRFIFQQTFVTIETKSQDIILGNTPKIIDLLRFLRDKFDIDYLFLKLLNEGQENKMTLQDAIGRGTPSDFDTDDEEEYDEEAAAAKEAERAKREDEIKRLREQAEKARLEEERLRAEREKLDSERRQREEEERLQREKEEEEELAKLSKEDAERAERERLEIERLEEELKKREDEERQAREEEEKRRQEEEKRREALRIAAEKKAKEAAERERLRQARLEEERKERQRLVAERNARKEAEQKAREAAEHARKEEQRKKEEERKRLESERLAKQEAERLERIRKAQEKAEQLAREKAQKELEGQIAMAQKKAREEADLLAKQEAERRSAEAAAREKARLAREEAERKVREEAERQAREEADRKAQEEAVRRAREEAERKAKEEAERKAKAEAEAQEKARRDAEKKRIEEEEARLAEERRLEAEARAKKEAELRAQEEAEALKAKKRAEEAAQRAKEAKEEAERKAAQDEADRLAREEAARVQKAKEEAERRAKEEAARRAKEEAELFARKERLRKAHEEAERKAKVEAERKAKEEAERKARVEAARKAREEAELKAKEEAARKAKQEAERKAKETAERKARAEAERQAHLEAERKAKQEAERKAKEEAERRAKEAAEKLIQERIKMAKEEAKKREEERIAREEEERKARESAEREAREKAEREAQEAEEQRIRAAEEARILAAKEKARLEAEELAKEEAKRIAREKAEHEAEEAEKRAIEEEQRRLAEEERKIAEAAEQRRRDQQAALEKAQAERKAKEERIKQLREMAMAKAKERAASRNQATRERQEQERKEAEARAAQLAAEEAASKAKAEADKQRLAELEKKQQEATTDNDRRKLRRERRDANKTSTAGGEPALDRTPSGRVKSMWVQKAAAAEPDKRRSLVLQKQGTKERIVRAQNTVRKRVATELLETEKSYVKNMGQVMDLLAGPVLNASKQGMRIMKDSEFYSCFANLPQLLEHHKVLLAEMTERIEKNWTDDVTLGDIFLKASKSGTFEDYRDYLINYSVAVVAVQSMVQKYERFANIVNFFEAAQLQGSKLNLESFLIMPVQRVPRYILLMRDMLKYTHDHHPDKKVLTEALETISATMKRHNQQIDPKASDYAHKLLAVSGSIRNSEALQSARGITGGGLVTPSRRWLHEGELSCKVKEKKGSKSMRPGLISCKTLGIDTGNKKPKTFCFLFNDILLHCEQVPANKSQTGKEQEQPFIFTAALPLVEVKCVEPDATHNKGFSLVLVNGHRWAIKAESKDGAEEWEAKLTEAVKTLNA